MKKNILKTIAFAFAAMSATSVLPQIPVQSPSLAAAVLCNVPAAAAATVGLGASALGAYYWLHDRPANPRQPQQTFSEKALRMFGGAAALVVGASGLYLASCWSQNAGQVLNDTYHLAYKAFDAGVPKQAPWFMPNLMTDPAVLADLTIAATGVGQLWKNLDPVVPGLPIHLSTWDCVCNVARRVRDKVLRFITPASGVLAAYRLSTSVTQNLDATAHAAYIKAIPAALGGAKAA